VVQNDARRYCVRCERSDCSFRLNFNFRNQLFGPPTVAIAHNCGTTTVAVSRAERPSYLARMLAVREWMHQEGRKASTDGLRRRLLTMGIDPSYNVLYRTLQCMQCQQLRKAIEEATLLTYQATSQYDFSVTAQTEHGPRWFQVSLAGGVSCSCGRPVKFLMPCPHAICAIQSRQLDVDSLFCPSWTKDVYLQACAEPATSRPLVNKDNLVPGQVELPVLGRRRGRPKQRRIESKPMTQELEAALARRYRCGRCHEFGHTRPRCPRAHENQE